MISAVAPLSLSISSPLFLTSSVCLLEWLEFKIACRRLVGMRMPHCTLGISGMVQWTQWSALSVNVCLCVWVRERERVKRGVKLNWICRTVNIWLQKNEQSKKQPKVYYECLHITCVWSVCSHQISWQGTRRETWEKHVWNQNSPYLGTILVQDLGWGWDLFSFLV